MIDVINNWIQIFYDTYAMYLRGSTSTLCQQINHENPIESLIVFTKGLKCTGRAQRVRGVYLIVDEYDSFANDYLEPYHACKYRTSWICTDVGGIFKGFWSTVKSFSANGPIKRSFITGISPFSLTNIAGLCGLTRSELENVFEKVKPQDLTET